MCALKAHIKPSIFRNIFLGIEKVLIAFLISEKIFLKIDGLMCALRLYINQTLHKYIFAYLSVASAWIWSSRNKNVLPQYNFK